MEDLGALVSPAARLSQREGGEMTPRGGPLLASAPVSLGAAEPPVAGCPISSPLGEPQNDQLHQDSGQESPWPHAALLYRLKPRAPGLASATHSTRTRTSQDPLVMSGQS